MFCNVITVLLGKPQKKLFFSGKSTKALSPPPLGLGDQKTAKKKNTYHPPPLLADCPLKKKIFFAASLTDLVFLARYLFLLFLTLFIKKEAKFLHKRFYPQSDSQSVSQVRK